MAVLDPNPIIKMIARRGTNNDEIDEHLQPQAQSIPATKEWKSLPSIVTWFIQRSTRSDGTQHFWIQLADPLQQAGIRIIQPLQCICGNLANAWDLRDLADDLRFHEGMRANRVSLKPFEKGDVK